MVADGPNSVVSQLAQDWLELHEESLRAKAMEERLISLDAELVAARKVIKLMRISSTTKELFDALDEYYAVVKP